MGLGLTGKGLPPSITAQLCPSVGHVMLPFQSLIAPDLQRVNQLIIDQLNSQVDQVENIGHYIVDAGGKRLRPILVLLTAHALGYNETAQALSHQAQEPIALAAIIEFIHTATLLHDDVVDMSQLRRGRPTANAQFGNAPSVLVGDFLYSRAFQMMVRLGRMPIMANLADTTNLISEGEVQQLVYAKNANLNEAQYLDVIRKKTAILFESACGCGALLCEVPVEQYQQAALYGHHLGMAFQLIDDSLDYQGDAATMGKNVGDDLMEGKMTLPLIYTLQQLSEPDQKAIIKRAVEQGELDNITQIIDWVNSLGGLEYTRTQALEHAQKAKACLANFKDSSWRTALLDLADFAVQRAY